MSWQIRELRADDREAWLAMSRALFPDEADMDAECAEDFDFYLSRPDVVALVAEEQGSSSLLGMIQIETRSYAEGCGRGAVAYVEGWFVRPEHQRSGMGRALLAAAEAWAIARGHRQLGSNCLLDNEVSLRAHLA
ncbi:MAG: GNAT family N-acetyltransferase, partial [Planctomycetota bacterium]